MTALQDIFIVPLRVSIHGSSRIQWFLSRMARVNSDCRKQCSLRLGRYMSHLKLSKFRLGYKLLPRRPGRTQRSFWRPAPRLSRPPSLFPQFPHFEPKVGKFDSLYSRAYTPLYIWCSEWHNISDRDKRGESFCTRGRMKRPFSCTVCNVR